MKIREGFVLRNIADEYIVMPVGERMHDFSNVLVLNESGAFIWKCLQNGIYEQQDLVCRMLEEFDVSKHDAEIDVQEYIGILSEMKLLED